MHGIGVKVAAITPCRQCLPCPKPSLKSQVPSPKTEEPSESKRCSTTKCEGKHSELTDQILNEFYKVHRTLGYGLNEEVYENSLVFELRCAGPQVAQQQEIHVSYETQLVGNQALRFFLPGLRVSESYNCAKATS